MAYSMAYDVPVAKSETLPDPDPEPRVLGTEWQLEGFSLHPDGSWESQGPVELTPHLREILDQAAWGRPKTEEELRVAEDDRMVAQMKRGRARYA